jgi:hypothetical protein
LYSSKEDIQKILDLMIDIQEGKISRNKNYYTLAKSKEYNRFKRAKLILSLKEDLDKAADIDGGKVDLNDSEKGIEVSLYNPSLKYNRKVILSSAELELLKTQTNSLSKIL